MHACLAIPQNFSIVLLEKFDKCQIRCTINFWKIALYYKIPYEKFHPTRLVTKPSHETSWELKSSIFLEKCRTINVKCQQSFSKSNSNQLMLKPYQRSSHSYQKFLTVLFLISFTVHFFLSVELCIETSDSYISMSFKIFECLFWMFVLNLIFPVYIENCISSLWQSFWQPSGWAQRRSIKTDATFDGFEPKWLNKKKRNLSLKANSKKNSKGWFWFSAMILLSSSNSIKKFMQIKEIVFISHFIKKSDSFTYINK